MKTKLLGLTTLALGLFLFSAPASADDWSVFWANDDFRLRVGSGHDRNPHYRPHHYRPPVYRHTCTYEWRQVPVTERGHYDNVLIPAHWDTVATHCCAYNCGHIRQVWVPARYEQRWVPGRTTYVWQRVAVCCR